MARGKRFLDPKDTYNFNDSKKSYESNNTYGLNDYSSYGRSNLNDTNNVNSINNDYDSTSTINVVNGLDNSLNANNLNSTIGSDNDYNSVKIDDVNENDGLNNDSNTYSSGLSDRYSASDLYNSRKSYYEEDIDIGPTESSSKKKIIIVLIVLLLILVGVVSYFYFNQEKPEPEATTPPVVQNKLIESYNGYKVLGKIVIDQFNVEQYILDSTENLALKNGVGKLYGDSLNSYGNFCIAGHNYENIFGKLVDMSVGDTFKIIDKDMEETIYEVKEIYRVEPDDLKCLLQDESKIQITLITCENGSTSRLIIKAEEKQKSTTSSLLNNTNSTSLENTTTN